MTERGARLRRLGAWCVALPAMLAGSQVAHALAYRLAYPNLEIRIHVLASSGHGYLGWLPLALGVAGAIAVCSLVWTIVDAGAKRRPRPIPPLAFAVLPPLAFTLQEFTERWLAVGGLPWWMVEQPTFRIGLALQLPFAFAAFVTTSLLLRGAHALGRRLVAPARRSHDAPPVSSRRATGVALVATPVPAPRWTRGPPLAG